MQVQAAAEKALDAANKEVQNAKANASKLSDDAKAKGSALKVAIEACVRSDIHGV